MKKQFFFLLIIFLSTQLSAQPDPLAEWNKNIIANWGGQYFRVGPYMVKGVPFLLGEAFPGQIIYKNGTVLSDKKIYYDVYHQKLGVDNNNLFIDLAEPIEKFTLELPEKFGGNSITFTNSNEFLSTAPVPFFNVLADGKKISFFKTFSAKLIPDPVNIMAKDVRAFEQFSEYYLFNKTSQTLHQIKLKEKDLFKFIGENKEIKNYIKKNQIDVSNETEFSKIIYLLNNN